MPGFFRSRAIPEVADVSRICPERVVVGGERLVVAGWLDQRACVPGGPCSQELDDVVEPEPGPVRACMDMNTGSEPQFRQPVAVAVAVALAEPLLTAEQVADLLAIPRSSRLRIRATPQRAVAVDPRRPTPPLPPNRHRTLARRASITDGVQLAAGLVHGRWSGAARERSGAGAIHLPPATMGDERRVTVCGTSRGWRARPHWRSPWRPDQCATRSGRGLLRDQRPDLPWNGSGRRSPRSQWVSRPSACSTTHSHHVLRSDGESGWSSPLRARFSKAAGRATAEVGWRDARRPPGDGELHDRVVRLDPS
jgi:hypothetical protein